MAPYGAREREFQAWWDRLRRRALRPLLALLLRRGVTPQAITLTGLVLALVSSVVAASGCLWVAVVLHLSSWVLDGLDGPLSREGGTSSEQGGRLDAGCDWAGSVAWVAGAMAGFDLRWLLMAGAYAWISGWLFVWLELVGSRSCAPRWVIRPRMGVFVASLFVAPASPEAGWVVAVACLVCGVQVWWGLHALMDYYSEEN